MSRDMRYILPFFLICVTIFLCVIFIEPIVGVADQGDFSRVFFGIEWPYPNFWQSDHFFQYVTPDYDMTPFPHESLYRYPYAVSQIYFVYAGRLLSRLIGLRQFSQYVYAVFAGLIYILGLTTLYAALLPREKTRRILLGAGLLLVFMDGRWLQWFNSLYGEPVVMIGLLFTAAFFLLLCRHIERLPLPLMLLLCGAEIIMLGGKLQAVELFVTVLPLSVFLAVMLLRTEAVGRQRLAARGKVLLLLLLTALQVHYCFGVYNSVGVTHTNKDTLYQSVFFGLLRNADDPAKVIEDWDLDPAFMSDVGLSAYLPAERYTFGSIHSERMQTEFFDKISYTDVLRYYLTHPADLWKGMVYLGEKSLRVTNNGVHPRGYEVTTEHNRFTLWTSLRHLFPRNVFFLFFILGAVAAVSVILFRRGQHFHAILLWALSLGGCLQFPMPYLFNGMSDTAKQLMIFDFIFDMLFFALCMFAFTELGRLISNRRQKSR